MNSVAQTSEVLLQTDGDFCRVCYEGAQETAELMNEVTHLHLCCYFYFPNMRTDDDYFSCSVYL